MTTNPTGKKQPPTPTKPVYSESELYDSPEELANWPGLKPLLQSWQAVVWGTDHSEDRGFWHYDQGAIRLQWWHQWAVYSAALMGTLAVVLVILQLGLDNPKVDEKPDHFLVWAEVACLVAAIATVILGLYLSFDHRWREFRFKAEQYRMLKFRFLHDAVRWLAASEDERTEHLQTHISKIQAANRHSIKAWIYWKEEILPELVRPKSHPDAALATEITWYFRERRLIPQQEYFKRRGHKLHSVERRYRWIGPTFFFASVVFALAHAFIHVDLFHIFPNSHSQSDKHEYAKKADRHAPAKPAEKAAHSQEAEAGSSPVPDSSSARIIFWVSLTLAFLAALLPVMAAGIRTCRGAFEFGRNSLRFESMAHHLGYLIKELKSAESPEGMLAILRRGEYAMESEHRSWMRLMMEAEWFG